MSPRLESTPLSLLPITLAGLCALAVLVGTSPAFGDEQHDDPEAHAQQLFAEGSEYFEDGDYEQAAEYFGEAYEILEVPELLYNMGTAYRRADDLVRAEQAFQDYLSEASDPDNEDQVAEIIIDIQQELTARKATIDLESDPPGTTIAVDGDDNRCDAPCTLELIAGEYTLVATHEGYETARRDIELAPDQQMETAFHLIEDIVTGELTVRTDVHEATLIADDERHALPRTEPVELREGTHTIGIESGGELVEHTVDIDPDQPLHLFVPVEQAGGSDISAFQLGAIGLGGTSLALGTAATFTGLQARSTHRALEAQQNATGGVDADLVDTGERQRRLTNGLWLGAALTLGAGAGLWTWDMLQRRDDGERLEPTEQPDDDGPDVDLL